MSLKYESLSIFDFDSSGTYKSLGYFMNLFFLVERVGRRGGGLLSWLRFVLLRDQIVRDTLGWWVA
ncbi:MAG: hypothetical protein QXZ14_08915 [Candidatus Jordarchaeales archaeon]